MDAKQIKLGLVGYGVVGSSIGSGIRERGLISVAAYDIAAFEGPYSQLIQTRAREAGVALVASPAELAERADAIIAVVPGTESVNAARAIAPYLDAHHLYVDIASATPKVKLAVGRGGSADLDTKSGSDKWNSASYAA